MPTWVPWIIAVSVTLLLLVGAALLIPTLALPNPNVWAFPGFGIVASAALLLLGLAISTRRPENVIGWLFLCAAVLGAVQTLGSHYLSYSVLVLRRADDLARFAWWIASWLWIPLVLCVTTYMFVLYPDGRTLGPAWRWVLRAGTVAAILAVVAGALDPGLVEATGAFGNPFGITGAGPILGPLTVAATLAMIATMGAGVAALLARLRGASGVERKQIQWLLAAGMLVSAAFVLYALAPARLTEILVVVGLLAVPGAATIAILRYRLWDIDIIINRTLVYVPLTGLLAGLYTIAVAAFQRVFVAITGETTDAPVILSALVLASLFTPIKNRLQAAVDERFKGDADPTGRLVSFAKEVGDDYRLVDPRRLARRLVDQVSSSTGATSVHLELAGPTRGRTETFGRQPQEVAASAKLESAGRSIGRLQIGPRASGRPYRAADITALEAAASAVAEAISDFVASERWQARAASTSPKGRP